MIQVTVQIGDDLEWAVGGTRETGTSGEGLSSLHRKGGPSEILLLEDGRGLMMV